MKELLSSLAFSANVALPNVLMLMLGLFLRNRGFIDEKFTDQASKIVFHVTLPLLLFLSISTKRIDFISQITLIFTGLTGTLLLYFLGELLAAKWVRKKERGIMVQALFRGNAGILGVSLCSNAYGTAGVATAAVYVAAVVLLYNVLSVITLTRSLSENTGINMFGLVKQVFKNPMILGITSALIANGIRFTLPQTLHTTAIYLANITLPLALLCAGASLNFKSDKNKEFSQLTLWAALGRAVVAPVTLLLIGKSLGLRGMELGVVFFITATPLAAAAYPMVRSMGGNASLTANIIGLTTIASMLSVAVGTVILKQTGWI